MKHTRDIKFYQLGRDWKKSTFAAALFLSVAAPEDQNRLEEQNMVIQELYPYR